MKAFLSSTAALALIISLVLPIRAEPPGTIEGQVVNGTKGGTPPAGLEVTLLNPSATAGPEQRTTADQDGKFRFTGLTATAPMSYTISTSYASVEYRSPAIAFIVGEELKRLDLTVYDNTEDSNGIRTDLVHIVIEIDPGYQTLVVSEFQALSNLGDKTYLGPPSPGSEKRTSLRFLLPSDAVHLQSLDSVAANDLTPLSQGVGFAATAPFLPGKREVAFSYMLDYMDPNYTFLRPLAYPTARINLLVSDVGAQISAPGLVSQRTLDIEGKKFLLLSGESLRQGQTLEVQFRGLPLVQGEAMGVVSNLKLAAVALPIAALGLAMLFYVTRGRRRQVQRAATPTADEEKTGLVQALADLDDQFEADSIPEAEYQRLRAAVKRRLVELW